MVARPGLAPFALPPLAVAAAGRPARVTPVSRTNESNDGKPPAYGQGGEIVDKYVHPNMTTFERLFQSLPEEGMFMPGLTSRNPFQFTVGSYTVPKGMTLWLEDYGNCVLLPDPVNAGDYRYAEDGRFSGNLGFDMTVSDSRNANIVYQLDPAPIAEQGQEFEQVVIVPGNSRVPPVTSQFNRSAATSFASVAGSGSSLQPPRRRPAGPHSRPYVWEILEDQTIAVRCVVFRRVLTPIAGISCTLAGHLMQNDLAISLRNRQRPR